MTISSMKNVLSARKQLICSINVNRPSTSTANKLPDWIKPPVVEDGEETPVPKSTENPSFFARIFPRGKGTSIDKHGGAAVDSNLYIPNEKGIAFNPSMPLGELIKATKNMPKFYATEMKKLIDEQKDINNTFNLYNKPRLVRDAKGIRHGETIIEYDFTTEESMKNWQIGCDSDWSEGYSKCELYRTDRNTAILEGNISTRLVKDGKTIRAGWCSMKTIDRLAFNRRRHYLHWEGFSHLLIKCRGDGRSYKIMLHMPEYYDITWGDSYSYPLHTHGGPYWQYEEIPFSRFFHTFAGRIQDRQEAIAENRTSSLGIVLMDRIDGPFKFELAFIGVTHDISHKETFAYETYNVVPP